MWECIEGSGGGEVFYDFLSYIFGFVKSEGRGSVVFGFIFVWVFSLIFSVFILVGGVFVFFIG